MGLNLHSPVNKKIGLYKLIVKLPQTRDLIKSTYSSLLVEYCNDNLQPLPKGNTITVLDFEIS